MGVELTCHAEAVDFPRLTAGLNMENSRGHGHVFCQRSR